MNADVDGNGIQELVVLEARRISVDFGGEKVLVTDAIAATNPMEGEPATHRLVWLGVPLVALGDGRGVFDSCRFRLAR